MCGICGMVRGSPGSLADTLVRMNESQAHRGPDGCGYYLSGSEDIVMHEGVPGGDASGICGMGHSRLAIIDPARGRQPMTDREARLSVVHNGEIYNFVELRRRLESRGYTFHTDCDTEVLLKLYAEEPDHPEEWIRDLDGIFAFALWDAKRGRLLLARDHFGVKPLHYASMNGCFFFASEAKALLAGGVQARLNGSALHVFLNIRYIPGNETLFDGIHRFPPAHCAFVKDGRLQSPIRYYRLPPDADAEPTGADLREEVRAGFYEAVERQLLSDVPLGITLSGGLDSSMLVAGVSRAYSHETSVRTADKVLRTFTLGFNEPTDELGDAKMVADRFDTEHHEHSLSLEPLSELETVIRAVEEPKVNILQGYALFRMIKEQVNVVLGGLGGDELFAGYDIHRFCNTLGRLHRVVPSFLHQFVLGPLGRAVWAGTDISGCLKTDLYGKIGAQIGFSLGDRAQFYTRLRNAWDFDGVMYERIYADPQGFRACPPVRAYFDQYFRDGRPFLDQVLRAEFQTKMVNDFLLNEDRVSSAHGVESRVPFLDRKLVELAFQIPGSKKMHGWETKSLWKRSVGEALPSAILRKKKQGFTFSSYDQWCKDLKTVARRELNEDWCRDTGLFNHAFIRRVVEYPPHPNLRWHYFLLWMMLGVKVWMKTFAVSDIKL